MSFVFVFNPDRNISEFVKGLFRYDTGNPVEMASEEFQCFIGEAGVIIE
jgi:hypothetical protein